jgi:FtsH-binding integral membrane protein
MSKKPPRAHRTGRAAGKRRATGEGRAADTLTIAWMLATATTLGCELLGLVAALVVRIDPQQRAAGVLQGLLLFAALVIGLVVVALTPVVLRVRRQPPPIGITAFALAVGLAPLALAGVRALWDW